MKNKNGKKVLIGLLVFAVVFSSVYSLFRGSYAAESTGGTGTGVNGKLVLNCNKNVVSASGTVVCTLQGTNFTTQVSSITAKLVLDSNFTLQNITFEEGDGLWQGDTSGGKIDLFTEANKTGTFNIAEITLKASSNAGVNANVTIDDIIISDEKFDEFEMSDISLGIKIASNDANLSSLTVTGASFTFNPNTTSYNLNVDAQQVTIIATTSSNLASVTGTGSKTLNYGINEFDVVVTAEDGTTKKYTLSIMRPDKLVFAAGVLEEEDYLTFVMKDTNVTNMLTKIDTSGTITVKNSDGIVASASALVGTGFNVNIVLNSGTRNYDVVVLGDTTGDGKITVSDVSRLFQVYRGTNSMGDIYKKAGDVVADSQLRLPDVSKLFQYVRGSLDSLN